MVTLKGAQIYLRALEPEDLEFIYKVENDERIWEVSATQTPYSKFLIKQYLENAHQDIYEAKQLRLVICVQGSDKVVGLIDLYDFNPTHRRVGVGILILEDADRRKGYAKEALKLVLQYGKSHLHLHQMYATIAEANKASQDLFSGQGFQFIGQRKDWNLFDGKFHHENFYQHIYVH